MNPKFTLPEPSSDAQDASIELYMSISNEIRSHDGWIPFSKYMDLALYTPGLGYYSGGSQKFGVSGDFITAPETTPLFARTLSRLAAHVMTASSPCILEVGAGSGVLASELLLELEREDCLPDKYAILELSGVLRARQKVMLSERAAHLLNRVTWLDTLPSEFSGLVLGNELLDAFPVDRVEWRDRTDDGTARTIMFVEHGVGLDEENRFVWACRPAQGALLKTAQTLNIAPPYVTEIGLAAIAWIAEWGERLTCGALLLIDYGDARPLLYHPQRSHGTLMCHYRHRAHNDPFWLPGLNDITAHVDFTAVAESAFEAGLDVLGYTSQSRFLLNCGITCQLERLPGAKTGEASYLDATRAVDKLISPHAMGERFKVMALGRGLVSPLPGFAIGDRTHTL